MTAPMRITTRRVLPFAGGRAERGGAGGASEGGEDGAPRVGHVHRDGSITYRGETYRTIKDVPAECLAIRPDQDTLKQWTRLYRAMRPDSRRVLPLHLKSIP